ncbi:4-O-dimethylallyl-L-tyrosine synthase [Hypsizygus marmoreus]|uniref:4-O-dimethylallyl-L-tyrosine synthase n=1 Tax=Hypsizygus marmoreus TaxID=39966 RepID=A0A369JSP1_HYPMA|nr:4-O-dimethylallyl-L-tyrosine synthase [Hypsizygus marmoreus]
METLVHDARFFTQMTSKPSAEWDRGDFDGRVLKIVSSVLGLGFKFNPSTIIDDSEQTGLVVYDELTKLLPPRSPHSIFFWKKVAKPFASMLQSAKFPFNAQVSFLTYMYARLLGIMGPLDERGSGSLMTFDGSPVELSWVIPKSTKSCPGGTASRQLRFAIEPIDPRSGLPLKGAAVLKYLTSPVGGLGLVRCEEGGLDWSMSTDRFLSFHSKQDDTDTGNRFFIGFDFSPSGSILLKTYYLPRPRSPLVDSTRNIKRPLIGLWDVNYSSLRTLLAALDPNLTKSLNVLCSYIDGLAFDSKPRLQILSVDCTRKETNRLKLYCRPTRGNSWSDAERAFTLGGRLDSPEMKLVVTRLKRLWDLLFPFADSQSNRDLDEVSNTDLELDCNEKNSHRHPDHPSGGLLYYYSLLPGTHTLLPKIYLPVSRYCQNDLIIAQAVEKFEASEGYGGEPGWLPKEVSAAYNHRNLAEKRGIHTYVTFALKKNYGWELTMYFSPEVWES